MASRNPGNSLLSPTPTPPRRQRSVPPRGSNRWRPRELDLSQAHEDNIAIGHKAALKNPNVSEEAKEHSAHVLEDLGRA
ncbi:hypothetical protein A0H81_00688 [Grifola frondosa]|uniref:Conidiation-specific protein 6 n=1 Tax=Grifola frondosa TaxID=5627 RepID=A0A1C7MRC2_GRIFR|nr:hypothetical protein A0H81_00688 [Grifola frondosa]